MEQKDLRQFRGYKLGDNKVDGINKKSESKSKDSGGNGVKIQKIEAIPAELVYLPEQLQMEVLIEEKVFIFQKDLPAFYSELNKFLDSWQA
jgi:hypothetical protein